MASPTANIPTTGTDPKVATTESFEADLQAVFDDLYARAVRAGGMFEIYDTDSEGLADTESGDNYLVSVSGEAVARIYENVGNVATYTNVEIASTAQVNTLIDAEAASRAAADKQAIKFSIDAGFEFSESEANVIFREIDDVGNVLRSIDTHGRHDMLLSSTFYSQNIAGGFSWIDDAGVEVIKVESDLTKVFFADNDEEVFADADVLYITDKDSTEALTTTALRGNVKSARLSADGQSIRYVSDLSGRDAPYVLRRADRNSHAIYGDGIMRAVYGYGQSFIVGVQSSPVANNTTPLFPSRNLMSNGADSEQSPRVIDDPTFSSPDQRRTLVPFDNLDRLVDLREGTSDKCGETMFSRLGAQLQSPAAYDGERSIIFNTFGVGGSSYNWLGPEDPPWANLRRAAFRHRDLAFEMGFRGFEIMGLVWAHGHSNAGTDKATYMGYLDELEQALSDLCGDLGQTAVPFFALNQISTSKFGVAASDVPLAQLEWGTASSSLSTRVMFGPNYPIEIGTDGTHFTPYGTEEFGDRAGLAIVDAVFESGWTPLHMRSAWGAGTNRVNMSFRGAVGDLAFDTTIVSDPGNNGFVVRDDSGEVPITTTSITNSNTRVRIDLGRNLTSNPTVEYALTGVLNANNGPTSGPRGTLRDSRPGTLASGNPAHQYCAVGKIDIT